MMKKLIALLLALLMAFCLFGCAKDETSDDSSADSQSSSDSSSDDSSSASGDSKGTIVFSTKTITNNEFQRVMVEAAQEVIEASGYTYELILSGDELAVAKQVENIENAVNKGVAGIIVAPMDGNAVIPALEKAKDAGIPVIIADASIDEGHEDLYVTYVGSDNVAIGKEGAKQMVEKIGEGEVLLVMGAAGAMGGELRSQGFREGIEEYGAGKVTLVDEQYGDWLSDTAMQVTENMLTAHPDAKGIFLCSDGMLSGVISACENKGYEDGEICIISVDGNISALDCIEDGSCYGCVAQMPAYEGKTCAEYMVSILNGESKAEDYEKFYDAGYFFMNPDNIEESRDYAF